MRICIFEDDSYENFYPLVYLRAVFELRCGQTLLLEKIRQSIGEEHEFCYWVREPLVALMKERLGEDRVNNPELMKGDDVLFVNGRCLLIGDATIKTDGAEVAGMAGEDIAYARLKKDTLEKVEKFETGFLNDIIKKQDIAREEPSVKLISYPWDLINNNPEAITSDFSKLKEKGIQGTLSEQAAVYGSKEDLFIGKGAEVDPFVILDTSGGPIIIEEGVKIYSFTRVEGPASIGRDTQLFGAKIREGTSLGPVCRVGGEVEEAIMHGYSNKYHDGFLGHAYVGEWVNLGAFTTNSDLKNDYSAVSVYIKGDFMDSGSAKVGSFIGDHTKTSIGTLLNTGSVVGVMCNVIGSGGVLPKFIPSCCWFMNNKVTKGYGFKMLVQTAKAAMSRRGKEMSEAECELLEYVRDVTKEERNALIKKGRRV